MQDVKAAVDGFLALMEVAAERDMEDNKRGKPALYKLKMLPEVRPPSLPSLDSSACACDQDPWLLHVHQCCVKA